MGTLDSCVPFPGAGSSLRCAHRNIIPSRLERGKPGTTVESSGARIGNPFDPPGISSEAIQRKNLYLFLVLVQGVVSLSFPIPRFWYMTNSSSPGQAQAAFARLDTPQVAMQPGRLDGLDRDSSDSRIAPWTA
jgi:hypothetical protein